MSLPGGMSGVKNCPTVNQRGDCLGENVLHSTHQYAYLRIVDPVTKLQHYQTISLATPKAFVGEYCFAYVFVYNIRLTNLKDFMLAL